MKRLSIVDITTCIATVLLVAVMLVPAVARLQRTPEDARCQSNMRRFAESLFMYASDYDRRYPTNRLRPTGSLSATVPLSPRAYDANGNPIRFVNGTNWVEALYPYLISEAKKSGRDWESCLKCPIASNTVFPPTSETARVSYVFNYNLLEFSPGIIREPAKVMMMREFDRLLHACCRPANNTTAISTNGPQSPFLTQYDLFCHPTGGLNYKMHSDGSHILFADGHVSYFDAEYFPPSSPAAYFDPETAQWWNWTDNSNTALNKTIAITP